MLFSGYIMDYCAKLSAITQGLMVEQIDCDDKEIAIKDLLC